MDTTTFEQLLGKDISLLSTEDLRGINHFIIDEINRRTRLLRGTFYRGMRVIINDPRCAGKIYVIEKTTPKMAVLREEFYTGPMRTRATLSLLSAID